MAKLISRLTNEIIIQNEKASVKELVEWTAYQRHRLDHIDLKGVDLSCAIFRQCYFCHGFLREVDFRGTDLRDTRFEDTNLVLVDFRGANIKGANFQGAILNGAKFTESQVEDLLQCLGVTIQRR